MLRFVWYRTSGVCLLPPTAPGQRNWLERGKGLFTHTHTHTKHRACRQRVWERKLLKWLLSTLQIQPILLCSREWRCVPSYPHWAISEVDQGIRLSAFFNWGLFMQHSSWDGVTRCSRGHSGTREGGTGGNKWGVSYNVQSFILKKYL